MSQRLKVVLMMFVDAVAIAIAYRLALALRFGGEVPTDPMVYWPVAGAAIVAGLAMLAVYETYRDLHRPFLDTMVAILVATVLAGFIALTVPYAARLTAFPRSLFLIALPLQFLAVTAARVPAVLGERARVASRRIAVAGADEGLLAQVVDAVRRQLRAPHVESLVDASPEDLEERRPNAVVMTPDLDPRRRERLHAWCVFHDVSCLVIPRLEDVLFSRARVGRVGDFPTLEARRPVLSSDHALLKRATDVAGALLIGIPALPLLALSALAVKAGDASAPVLYRQRRVGWRGREFTLYKLRTMVPNAEDGTGPVLSSGRDRRVTRVGRVLRATRLDELPQLWNVLRGDMSLVGPRPERPEFAERFARKTPLYRLRHNVRPGVTGLAQVLGRYESDFRDKLRYDLLYVAYASPLLDLRIILLTLRVVLFPIRETPRVEAVLRRSWVATPSDDG